ncbi:MAG: OmpA family protein [Deltaproteobacteria bacterium]|nr:OmpA family protein [Deltaproteobacteria bacterium]
MKNRSAMFMAVFGVILSVLFVMSEASAQAIFKTETVVVKGEEIEIVKTADNFIILFDSSSSMGRTFKNTGKPRVVVEKEILKQRNRSLPDLKYIAGLYSFKPQKLGFSTKLRAHYDMKPYDREAFAKAIEELPEKASGPTMLQAAIKHLDPILAKLSGRTVVFVFTDGSYTKFAEARTPAQLAKELAQKYNVCFVVVSSAEGYLEKQMVKNVAAINECSRVISFEDLYEKPEFVAGSLFVIDRKVVTKLFEREKLVGFNVGDILFDFDKSNIKPEAEANLKALGKFMERNPNTYVILSGFTDSVGTVDYNIALSRRRAESVANYLTSRFNISQDRIVLQWYGPANPVASNDTPEGRAKNRRVVAVVAGLD